MFILVTLSDTLHLSPPSFSASFTASLLSSIHVKFCNKVLPGLGLLMSPHTLLSHSTPFLHPTDGGAHIRCTFSLITFQPFPGELLIGRIKACDESGVLVSVGFYDWVVVSAAELQHPSVWDEGEKLWVWRYEGHELYLDLEQEIRVKVTQVTYAKRESPAVEAEEAEEKEKGDKGEKGGGGGGGEDIAGKKKVDIASYHPRHESHGLHQRGWTGSTDMVGLISPPHRNAFLTLHCHNAGKCMSGDAESTELKYDRVKRCHSHK